MEDLKGKVVLVTGAARGMGKLEAMNFAREGARVVMTDIDEAELQRAAEEIRSGGPEIFPYVMDVSDREACFALAKKVRSEVGPVDVLVNNAGIFEATPVLDASERTVRRMMDVNYFGQVWMMQAFVPEMAARRSGHVVNICSVAGKVGEALIGPYCATKFAMIGITDAIRHELRKEGVGFTIVNPGYVRTGMFEGCRVPPVTRWQDPRKVADRVLLAVKKRWAEVCVPSFVVRATAFLRGLCAPRLTDYILSYLFRANRSFESWKKDHERPF